MKVPRGERGEVDEAVLNLQVGEVEVEEETPPLLLPLLLEEAHLPHVLGEDGLSLLPRLGEEAELELPQKLEEEEEVKVVVR